MATDITDSTAPARNGNNIPGVHDVLTARVKRRILSLAAVCVVSAVFAVPAALVQASPAQASPAQASPAQASSAASR